VPHRRPAARVLYRSNWLGDPSARQP
jgi:hypothetical protein